MLDPIERGHVGEGCRRRLSREERVSNVHVEGGMTRTKNSGAGPIEGGGT